MNADANMKRFFFEYDRIMLKSRFLSQLGAFLVVVLALVEIAWMWQAIYFNSPLHPDDLYRAIRQNAFQIAIATVFAIRFFAMFRRSTLKPVWAYGSWILAVAVSFLYFAESQDYWRPDPLGFKIYSNHPADPLEGIWSLYVLASGIRFVITTLVAYIKGR